MCRSCSPAAFSKPMTSACASGRRCTTPRAAHCSRRQSSCSFASTNPARHRVRPAGRSRSPDASRRSLPSMPHYLFRPARGRAFVSSAGPPDARVREHGKKRDMDPLTLGALAALGWGVYDFLVRFVSRGAGSLQAVLFVLVFGAAALAAAAVVSGEPLVPAQEKHWAVALSGIIYALALLAGFRAFAIGPVSLVAPIVATYPAFTMLWALANGSRPSLSDWAAVASVLAGVALVARYAAEQPGALPGETSASSRGAAIVLSGLASFGYAASF